MGMIGDFIAGIDPVLDPVDNPARRPEMAAKVPNNVDAALVRATPMLIASPPRSWGLRAG